MEKSHEVTLAVAAGYDILLANTHSIHLYSPAFDLREKQPLQLVCLKPFSFSPVIIFFSPSLYIHSLIKLSHMTGQLFIDDSFQPSTQYFEVIQDIPLNYSW